MRLFVKLFRYFFPKKPSAYLSKSLIEAIQKGDAVYDGDVLTIKLTYSEGGLESTE
jgi:hypothetical protein